MMYQYTTFTFIIYNMQLTKNKLLYRDTDVTQLQHMMQYDNFNMCSRTGSSQLSLSYEIKTNKISNKKIKQKTDKQKKSET